MKTRMLAAIILATAIPILASSAPQLVAPAYPGATPAATESYAVTFLTNDSPAAIRTFYRQHKIQLVNAGENDKSQTFSGIILDNRGVCLAEEKAGNHAPVEMENAPKGATTFPPDTAGVTVLRSKVPPAENNAYAINADKTSVFSGFQSEAISGRHTSAELVSVYNKYRWLETAFYPMHTAAKGTESYYKWLVAKTWARINAPQKTLRAGGEQMGQGAAAVAARMQKLIAEGHMQEAQRLGMKMQAAMEGQQQVAKGFVTLQHRDHWKEWMAVIKKLQAHAYKTKIVINTKPATWPMHNVCGG